jgi:hypothetical protein
MADRKVERKVGGTGKEWSAWIFFNTYQDQHRYTERKRTSIHDFTFKTDQIKQAKRIIFDYVCQASKRFKNIELVEVTIQAAPYLPCRSEDKRILDGRELLRNKFIFTHLSTFLKAKLDDIFVVGYGRNQPRRRRNKRGGKR